MAKLISAGLLMCRWQNDILEYFLVHPGGPFFKNKDLGVWSIPKGLPEPDEDLFLTAQREFKEETGIIPSPPYYHLQPIIQKGGKNVHAWAFEGNWNAEIDSIRSNDFEIEWPPRSGKYKTFPEQDKAEWMDLNRASVAIISSQIPLLQQALKILTELKSNF